MQHSQAQKTERKFKDTFFRTLFSEKEYLIELYNAVSGENIGNDAIVETFPANEMIAQQNDLAASIGNQLIVFFEHQSTNPINIPLRLLSYFNDTLYLNLVDRRKLFTDERVKIPVPKFYVLYNGSRNLHYKELRLSDAFLSNDTNPSLELIVEFIDIKSGAGGAVLTKSEALNGYTLLIEKIREHEKSGMTRDKAVATAIKQCIERDILRKFLTEHYAEVINMLTWDISVEDVMELKIEQAENRGRIEGEARGRTEGIAAGKVEGRQEGAERLAKLLKAGMTIEDALKQIKESTETS